MQSPVLSRGLLFVFQAGFAEILEGEGKPHGLLAGIRRIVAGETLATSLSYDLGGKVVAIASEVWYFGVVLFGGAV